MYPFARDHNTDCCYNIITTMPFSLRKEGIQRMECKYYILYAVIFLMARVRIKGRPIYFYTL